MNNKEIAKRVNLSVATISRALNNDSKVKPETRKKVLDAISSAGIPLGEVLSRRRTKKANKDFYLFWTSDIKYLNNASGQMLIANLESQFRQQKANFHIKYSVPDAIELASLDDKADGFFFFGESFSTSILEKIRKPLKSLFF